MLHLKEFAPVGIWKRRFGATEYQPSQRIWTVPKGLGFMPVYGSLYSWEIPAKGEDPNFAMPIIHEIIWDFDSSLGLEYAQEDARNFVTYLAEIHDVDCGTIGMYFSGQKGFHIVLPIASIVDMNDQADGLWGVRPQIIRNFALQIATGFKTLDQSVFDARRLFRLPYAVHPGSGLYKTPLDFAQLRDMTPDDIREYASVSQWADPVVFNTPVPSPSLYELLLQTSETLEASHEPAPRASLAAMFDIAAPGERNVRATQLAGVLVKAMDDLPMIREIMKLWNRQHRQPLSQHELDVVTTGVYQRYHTKAHTRRNHHVPGF
ncbi:MAG: hypothetical protein M5R41_19355 [Bacteroidia bacterium]|nr:hypothetical protein [Bacteroidia bacterium]